MMYAALQVAWNNSWLPVCNAADYRNAELAPVLWVFYVSKVRVPYMRRVLAACTLAHIDC